MSQELQLSSWALPVCLSPIAGSFAGVIIRRLPQKRDIIWSRSRCDACDTDLSPVCLVPIISYLALGGRCRTCRATISPFHLAIELSCVAVACWAAMVDRTPLWLWAACVLGWTLLVLSWIDAEHFRLPDALTLPLLVSGLATQALLAPEQLPASLVGTLLGYASFRTIAAGYRALREREGLGAGDAKLMAAAGAWLGWSALPDVVLVAALLGILAIVLGRLNGRAIDRSAAIPFGPFLSAAIWLTYIYGPMLLHQLN
ncbi:prepilin peptidase [Bradyrhizobium sp. 179]|uniref:prepilin peptidase n=1 Tax=Bradyrhizobium sp. 179 TaxID=2782648 RepID=UPI001FFBC679|nr:A24 family peptidase [Bradyrhizobium sp. 179]MCK1545714.1 prepilin peptidase [Bradyrhizobium sp. 179]